MNVRGGTVENHNSIMTPGVPAEMRTKKHSNRSLQLYRLANLASKGMITLMLT
jgi:hypothetical protein